MPTRADKIRADLLNASFQYVQGKRAFEGAITAARSLRWSDEEIAHVTGLSLAMIQGASPPRPG
jgi:hypothetical protein